MNKSKKNKTIVVSNNNLIQTKKIITDLEIQFGKCIPISEIMFEANNRKLDLEQTELNLLKLIKLHKIVENKTITKLF